MDAFHSFLSRFEKQEDNDEDYKSNILLKQESFYLLGFVSWLHHFDDLSHWEFRSGNNGFFALVSCAFMFCQMIILFDLAYEEDHLSYECKGNSARVAVVVCAILVTLIVALKMLGEERRAFGQRLVLIRHASIFPLFESLRCLLFSENRYRALKLVILTIFHGFRQYGVIVFVYVAAIEQLMLFDTILDYIINSVVVLVIAELDELAFKVLSRVELSLAGSEGHGGSDEHHAAAGNDYHSALLSPIAADVPNSHHHHSLSSSTAAATGNVSHGKGGSRHHNTIEQYLLKTEEGLQSQSRIARNSADDHNINSSMMVRDSQILYHHSPANIHEMVTLRLTRREYDAYLTFDYFMVRLNFIAMLLPLLNAKITGANCGRDSLYRVSELGMFALMTSRVLLNVYVDTRLSQHTRRTTLEVVWSVIRSILEHGIPCVGYVALMYLFFVEEFKPPMDDKLR